MPHRRARGPPPDHLENLCADASLTYDRPMKDKRQLWLPILLMLVFALTRWPGLLPSNFSAAYALAFCAGVYFPKRLAWWLPLATLLISDIALNVYYLYVAHVDSFKWTLLINYVAWAALICVGTRFNPKAN